jgi:hypothetical protein
MMTQEQIEERIALHIACRLYWTNILSVVHANGLLLSKTSLVVANVHIETCTNKIDELNYILSYNQ